MPREVNIRSFTLGIMKKFLRLSPWLSLAVPLLLLGSLMTLRSLLPSLFCVEINPGGKEFICGPAYSHIGISRLQLLGHFVWVLSLIAGGAEVFRRCATWPAVIAWSVSVLLLASLTMLWLTLPVEDCHER